MDAHELTDGVFKTMIIRMLKDLRKRIDDLTENLNNEMVGMKQYMETIKKNQQSNEEHNIKNEEYTRKKINSRQDEAENTLSYLEDEVTENRAAKKKKRNLKK